MARLTDEMVSHGNDEIASAPTTWHAFDILGRATRAMVERLMDLNHIDIDAYGRGEAGRIEIARAHGWSWHERDDDRPADGHGPCELGGFEPHSRRPGECRGCRRRRIDHRRIR